MTDDYEDLTFDELIERSSLGSPEVLAMRRLTPLSVRNDILAGVYGPQSDSTPATAPVT